MDLTNKLQEHVAEYCKKLSHKELQELVFYLGQIDSTPTKIQEEFCKKFLGNDDYEEFLQYYFSPTEKRPMFSNIKRINADLNELFNFVAWQSNLRISELLLELCKKKLKNAELELEIAKINLENIK